jgi:hypothetical protein
VTRAVGGAGAPDGTAGINGAANTGNGGSGAYGGGSFAGATGGKGVVIIRHPSSSGTATTTGSPTVTTSGGNTIYIFNDSGTIVWN